MDDLIELVVGFLCLAGAWGAIFVMAYIVMGLDAYFSRKKRIENDKHIRMMNSLRDIERRKDI